MAFRDILADPQKYPDGLVINPQDGSQPFSLGEMRQFVSEQFREREARLQQAQNEVVEMYQKVQQGQGQPAPGAAPAPVDLSDFKKDPYLGPWVSDYERRATELSELKAQLAAIQKQNLEMATEYVEDRIGRDFSSLGTKDYTREQVLKYAMDNKIVNARGLPDLKKAFDRLDEPKRLERMQAEAMKKGEQEALTKNAMRALGPKAPRTPLPQTADRATNSNLRPFSGSEKFKNSPRSRIGNAVAQAAADPEIMNQFNAR